MKTFILILSGIILFSSTAAQVPQGITNQGVVRDSNNQVIVNTTIGKRVSILKGGVDGLAVYVETHLLTTNSYGLITYIIGEGDVAEGVFAEIDWSDGPYFLKTETDPVGGTNYVISGVTQFLSVPYALHAQTAEEYSETDPSFTASPVSGISSDDIQNWDAAFDWGNHAYAGYISEETQTLADVAALDNSVNTQIKDLTDPTDPQDAATKAYVDLLKDYIDVLTERIEALEIETGMIIKDIDGNTYSIVTIGDQIWMGENLRVTRYNNGDDIPTDLSNTEWSNTTDGAYAIYNNDDNMLEAYGKLYNLYAVDDARGLCPAGWSVPSDADWTALVNYVVSEGFPNSDVPNGAANALKSCRQVGHPGGGDCDTSEHPRWDSHGTHYGFDEFGFSALPGGYRWSSGSFENVGFLGFWWSATVGSGTDAWARNVNSNRGSVGRGSLDKRGGFSVRCLRDID